MAVIINLATGEAIKTKQQPVWRAGGWDCGDIVYSDPEKKDFAAGPPSVGPIAFKLLFLISELVAIRALAATDPNVKEFVAIVDDMRDDVVDMSLDVVHSGIEYVMSKIYSAPEDQAVMHSRIMSVLSGNVD